jgi:hypothetical protein
MPRLVRFEDPYASTVLKYIPTEIVGAYLVIQGFLVGLSPSMAYWTTLGVSAALLVLCPLYIFFIQEVKKPAQLIVTSISYLVWLYTLEGPFTYWGVHDSRIASAILVVWTLVIPLIMKPKKE